MHLRGKSMEYKLFYPDGKSEVLLSVPKWDFGWQTNYQLKQPKVLPKGSRIMVTAYFDNSTKNRFNPDPTKDIRYGEPTYDEMMLGFMDYVTEQPVVAQVDPKILDSYTGRYEVRPGVFASVMREGNKLVVQVPMMGRLEFLPESATTFFLSKGNGEATFMKDDKGELSVLLEMGSINARAKKAKDAAPAAGGGGQQ